MAMAIAYDQRGVTENRQWRGHEVMKVEYMTRPFERDQSWRMTINDV